jgi:hypothetical protein
MPFLLALALWRRRSPLQSRPVRESGPLHSRRRAGLPHAGPVHRVRRAPWRLDLALSILFLPILVLAFRPARRLRRAGTLRQSVLPLRQAVLSLQTGLTHGIVAQIVPVGIGLAQRALPGDDLAADALGGVNLAHNALVTQRLLWRDHQGRRGKASAGAAPDGEAA